MLVVFHQKQPTVIKQSSVVNYLMQSVTSTWLHITVRFILGYVVRRLVIIIIIINMVRLNLNFTHAYGCINVPPCLPRVKLKNFACTCTVARNFGVCMPANEHT